MKNNEKIFYNDEHNYLNEAKKVQYITCEMIHVCNTEIFCLLWQKNRQRADSHAKKDTQHENDTSA